MFLKNFTFLFQKRKKKTNPVLYICTYFASTILELLKNMLSHHSSMNGSKLSGWFTLILHPLGGYFKSNTMYYCLVGHGFSWKCYAYSKTCPFCLQKMKHQRKTLFAYKCMATFITEKFKTLAKMKMFLEKCILQLSHKVRVNLT